MKIVRLQTIIINKGWQVKNRRFITNWIKTNKTISDTDTYLRWNCTSKQTSKYIYIQKSHVQATSNYHIQKFIMIIIFIFFFCFDGFTIWTGTEWNRIDYIIEQYFYWDYFKTKQEIAMNHEQNEHFALNWNCYSLSYISNCVFLCINGFIVFFIRHHFHTFFPCLFYAHSRFFFGNILYCNMIVNSGTSKPIKNIWKIIFNTNSHRHYLIFMCEYNNNNINNNDDYDANAHITGAKVCTFIIVWTFNFMLQFIFIDVIRNYYFFFAQPFFSLHFMYIMILIFFHVRILPVSNQIDNENRESILLKYPTKVHWEHDCILRPPREFTSKF